MRPRAREEEASPPRAIGPVARYEHGDAAETKRLVEAQGLRCETMAGDVGDAAFCGGIPGRQSRESGRSGAWRPACSDEGVDWIGAILDSIREMECPCCGAPLASCAVRGITAETDALVVRLACSVCGENSVAVVRRESPDAIAPITKDDVLDAHEFLKCWHGPLGELIGAA